MPGYTALTLGVIGLTALLVAVLGFRPSLTASRGGKMLAFVSLFVLPAVVWTTGTAEQYQRSEETRFCLSCHVMEPYGRSLYIDDAAHIPAAHFQNARIPRNEACYTCHTDYAMYGGLQSKIRGMRHMYVQYLGTVPKPVDIRLYTPYNNRECLHCHGGARSFEENPVHTSLMDAIKSNQMSCISSGCHDQVHDIAHLQDAKFWKETK